MVAVVQVIKVVQAAQVVQDIAVDQGDLDMVGLEDMDIHIEGAIDGIQCIIDFHIVDQDLDMVMVSPAITWQSVAS